ncbi:hypothetical protein [Chitinophaga sp. YIM B06452]|uniref:hypothetical protein n=1 Tax=Chitinophaga sp. YIM B06452 TaxID=3082158 RepID=UPI0031FE9496
MKTFHPLLLCMLLAAGCIKHPGPEVPPVPAKPQWLISKITLVRQSGEVNPLPGEPAATYLKQVYEFKYNGYYKPVSRHIYEAVRDTLNLQLAERDTLFYDTRHRVVQADEYLSVLPGINARRKFIYPGSDTLPSAVESWYSSYPNRDSLYLGGTTNFTYHPDTALAIGLNSHGTLDTTMYIYAGANRNFNRIISTTGYEEDIYFTFDNSPAIERLINLSHGLVWRLPMDYVSPPVLSRNNWTGNGPQGWQKFIEYNSSNLPGRYVITEYNPNPRRWAFRVEYFAPSP